MFTRTDKPQVEENMTSLLALNVWAKYYYNTVPPVPRGSTLPSSWLNAISRPFSVFLRQAFWSSGSTLCVRSNGLEVSLAADVIGGKGFAMGWPSHWRSSRRCVILIGRCGHFGLKGSQYGCVGEGILVDWKWSQTQMYCKSLSCWSCFLDKRTSKLMMQPSRVVSGSAQNKD